MPSAGKTGGRAFSLLEVLVALVIVSFALSWVLYTAGSASSLRFRQKEEEAVRNHLLEGLFEILSSPQERGLLFEGSPIEREKGALRLLYRYRVFWPFSSAYLERIEISDFSPPEVWENFLSLEGRGEPFVSGVWAEGREDGRLVLRLIVRVP